jgi:hypothetical protein
LAQGPADAAAVFKNEGLGGQTRLPLQVLHLGEGLAGGQHGDQSPIGQAAQGIAGRWYLGGVLYQCVVEIGDDQPYPEPWP